MSTEAPRTDTCPSCDGEGEVEHEHLGGGAGITDECPPDPVMVDCEECDGTGMIPAYDTGRTLVEVKPGTKYRYGDWHIEASDWLRPVPQGDWDFWHDDYDGADDSTDNRHGSAATVQGCIEQIEEIDE